MNTRPSRSPWDDDDHELGDAAKGCLIGIVISLALWVFLLFVLGVN